MANVSLGPSDSAVLSVAVVSSSATAIAAIAGGSGSIIRVYKLFLVTGGTTTITFEDGSTTLAGGLPMVANGSITLDLDGQPWFTCTRANNFTIGNSGNLQVSGAVYYTQTNYS